MNKFRIILPALFLVALMSSCFYEVVNGPLVEIYDTEEYETEELVRTYSDRYGTYEEYEYKAWIEVDLVNAGEITARNVSIEIAIYDGPHEYTSMVYVHDLHPGERTTVTYDTGYHSIYEYDDYEVFVYWE